MRIVFLAADDEFAGEMQRPLYERHPDWIVGSVVSSCVIYKKSKLGAFLFTLRKSGLVFLMEMVHIKMLRWRLGKQKRFLPSRLSPSHGLDQSVNAHLHHPPTLAHLPS